MTWPGLVVASLLTLAQHSPEHAHLLLRTCWGEVYTISLPTTADARGLSVALDREFTADLEAYVVPWLVSPESAPEPSGCWP